MNQQLTLGCYHLIIVDHVELINSDGDNDWMILGHSPSIGLRSNDGPLGPIRGILTRASQAHLWLSLEASSEDEIVILMWPLKNKQIVGSTPGAVQGSQRIPSTNASGKV